jgi:Skp family chaperone for outer membrane proteins
MKQWINNLIDKIGEKWATVLFWGVVIVGLIITSTIHYLLFTKPVEDRVSAEWQEKYDEMVERYEDQIDEMEGDMEDLEWEYDKKVENAKEEGYANGYEDGYEDGYYDAVNKK